MLLGLLVSNVLMVGLVVEAVGERVFYPAWQGTRRASTTVVSSAGSSTPPPARHHPPYHQPRMARPQHDQTDRGGA